VPLPTPRTGIRQDVGFGSFFPDQTGIALAGANWLLSGEQLTSAPELTRPQALQRITGESLPLLRQAN